MPYYHVESSDGALLAACGWDLAFALALATAHARMGHTVRVRDVTSGRVIK